MEHEDWPGTWDNWQDYHEPDDSPLDSPEPVMCGTGPYRFDFWIGGDKWSIVKFDDYWGGWPAPDSRGYVERVTVKMVSDWEARKTMFLDGQIDTAHVPSTNIIEVFGQPGIRCIYPLPLLSCTGIFFNFDINERSPYLSVPYPITSRVYLPPGTFNET